MKEIRLTNSNKTVLVDDEDYESLSQRNWQIDKDGYAYSVVTLSPYKHKNKTMHRILTNARKNQLVDHINRNKLDNRRENLRLCNRSGNVTNVGKRSDGIYSKFKGVTIHSKSKKWWAKIQSKGKRHSLGFFDTEIEAAKAYNQKALELHGEFAFLNEVG